MNSFDFAPLYRSAIGFDRLAQILDNSLRGESQPSYPPYNIELAGEDRYRITMAVAGFSQAEIDVEIDKDELKVIGRKAREESPRTYLHRGIAARDFAHRFQLAEHVRVLGASLDNGLLSIDLVREIPEAAKPRRIVINGGDNVELIDRKAA